MIESNTVEVPCIVFDAVTGVEVGRYVSVSQACKTLYINYNKQSSAHRQLQSKEAPRKRRKRGIADKYGRLYKFEKQ